LQSHLKGLESFDHSALTKNISHTNRPRSLSYGNMEVNLTLTLKVKRLGLRVSYALDNFLIYSKQTEWCICTQILFHTHTLFVTQFTFKLPDSSKNLYKHSYREISHHGIGSKGI